MNRTEFADSIRTYTADETRNGLAIKNVRELLLGYFSELRDMLLDEVMFSPLELSIFEKEDDPLFLSIVINFFGVNVSIHSDTWLGNIRSPDSKKLSNIIIDGEYRYKKRAHVTKSEYGSSMYKSLDDVKLPIEINDEISAENGVCKLKSTGETVCEETLDTILGKIIICFQFAQDDYQKNQEAIENGRRHTD